MIELGKKYQTRDGRAVRILATDVKNTAFPVLGLITFGENEDDYRWTSDGHYRSGDAGKLSDSDFDLVPVPTKHEGWGVIDRRGQLIGAYSGKNARELAYVNMNVFNGEKVVRLTWED